MLKVWGGGYSIRVDGMKLGVECALFARKDKNIGDVGELTESKCRGSCEMVWDEIKGMRMNDRKRRSRRGEGNLFAGTGGCGTRSTGQGLGAEGRAAINV